MKPLWTAQNCLSQQRGTIPAAAFSLIELLVVIAVLTLLAATQLPALTRAKAPVKFTLCLNNCRQIGWATMLYRADNNDAYPYGNRCNGYGTASNSVVDPYAWPLQLSRYLGGYQTNVQPPVYVCPSENATAYGWQFQIHYQANRTFVRDLRDSDQPLHGARVPRPAIYWMFKEKSASDFCNIRPGGLSLILLTWNYPPGPPPGFRRHNGGLTATAADGHAEWLRMPTYQPGRPPPDDLLELGDCPTGQYPGNPWPPNASRVKLYTRDCSAGSQSW